MTKKPFEGILGETYELKLLEFLLPLEGIEFKVDELASYVDIPEKEMTTIVKNFVDHDILKLRLVDNTVDNRVDNSVDNSVDNTVENIVDNIRYYSINKMSSIVSSIEDINNYLIEKILGEEMLYQINDYWKIRQKNKDK